jgi:hypothetical protein
MLNGGNSCLGNSRKTGQLVVAQRLKLANNPDGFSDGNGISPLSGSKQKSGTPFMLKSLGVHNLRDHLSHWDSPHGRLPITDDFLGLRSARHVGEHG